MKISKKVANGMAIGGLVGILSCFGQAAYFGIQRNRLHPVEQALVEIKDNVNACAYKHDEASCQKWKQQYTSLETELAHLENDPSYQQFMEDRDRNRTYSTSSVAGMLLMTIIMTAGGVIYKRRKDEEIDQYWEKQVQADRARKYVVVTKP